LRQLDVPYKPNPMKYKYLLNNKYETIDNLDPKGSGTKFAPEKSNEYSPGTQKKKKPILADFTMYKVNKEFENF
jgi:hypothetical protein